MSIFEVVRARPWGAYRCAIVGFRREHTLVREFLHMPSTLCSTVFCSFFDIFSCVHRVLRAVWYPIRHVSWVGLFGGPDDRKVARFINVAGERGVYLIASDADSVREKFCFWRGSVSAGRRMRALGPLVHIAGCMRRPTAGRKKAYPVRIS